jgi:hypothetical protein
MKRLLFFGLIILIVNYSCSLIHNKPIKDDYVPKFSASQLQSKLDEAFISKSKDGLIEFLKDWNHLIPASNINYIKQNDTILNIYSIFSDLYRPYSFGNSGTETPYKIADEYILIPGEIEYNVVSVDSFKILTQNYNLYKDYKSHLLTNFRPTTTIDPKKRLFLTKEYKEALNSFLGTLHSEVGQGDIMNPAQPKGESIHKFKFVRQYLPILEGHWGGYWYLETFPIVYRIILDEDFMNALVDFRDGYRTIMQYKVVKRKDKWIDDSKQTYMIRGE